MPFDGDFNVPRLDRKPRVALPDPKVMRPAEAPASVEANRRVQDLLDAIQAPSDKPDEVAGLDQLISWHRDRRSLVEMALLFEIAPDYTVWDGLTPAQRIILARISADPDASDAIREATLQRLLTVRSGTSVGALVKDYDGVENWVLPIECHLKAPDENTRPSVTTCTDPKNPKGTIVSIT